MFKRTFDVVIAALGLVILSPLFLVVSIVVKLHDRGPVFYRSRRVGLNGRLFTLYKFRTMRATESNIGAGITVANDSRITAAGRFLRKYKLDEFPQLVNVLKGDMSFVGPRPEDPWYTKLYDTRQQEIFRVRPGITSPASLAFKDESSLLTGRNWETVYTDEILPKKLVLDLAYFSRNTFWDDLRLIVRTLVHIFQ